MVTAPRSSTWGRRSRIRISTRRGPRRRSKACFSSCASFDRGKQLMPTPRADNLVWIDMEMTGLDPLVNVVLQAALVITNAALEPLDEVAVDIAQPEEALGLMSPFVREMHTRTGLIERVRRSTVDVATAE